MSLGFIRAICDRSNTVCYLQCELAWSTIGIPCASECDQYMEIVNYHVDVSLSLPANICRVVANRRLHTMGYLDICQNTAGGCA